MAKLEEFAIVLDEDVCVFKSGDIVSGKISVKFDRLEKVQGIDLKACGIAKVAWTESSGQGNRTRYTNREEYFNYSQSIWNNPDHSRYPDGVQSFNLPFNFTLPSNLPSSFKSENGHIKYTIKSKIHRENSTKKDKTKREIHIVKMVDLSQIPNTIAPKLNDFTKSVNYGFLLCWSSAGQIEVHTKMNRSAYVPGENALMVIRFTNNSNRQLLQWKGCLKQKIIYTSQNNHRLIRRRKLISSNKNNVISDNERLFNLLTLPLKHRNIIPEGCLEGCKFIQILYTIELKIWYSSVWKFKKFIKVKIPFQMGNISLESGRPGPESGPTTSTSSHASSSSPPPIAEVSQPTVTPTAPWLSADERIATSTLAISEDPNPPSYDSLFRPMTIIDNEDDVERNGNFNNLLPRYSFIARNRRKQNKNN